MSWWFRLRRLWSQDRIRLSPAEFRQPRLQVGDRLEIHGQLWKVEGCCPSASSTHRARPPTFELGTLGGPRRKARLRRGLGDVHRPAGVHRLNGVHRQDGGQGVQWLFEDQAGARRIYWRDVVHYSLGEAGSELRGGSDA